MIPQLYLITLNWDAIHPKIRQTICGSQTIGTTFSFVYKSQGQGCTWNTIKVIWKSARSIICQTKTKLYMTHMQGF